ncbi:beta-glucosidase BglX [Gracilimonas mengyeensis]|uniref:beta-glucosidase n=1 Tax=Gracilimonas mengyeensis TaxID=1302730 RepID=A0A521C0Q6_9BACT|nr:beta-glucosidase BglX [Gracilimonas mengyeensis]SMO53029.1 beta-glucosidase [Gracilimonas mengyeensis]
MKTILACITFSVLLLSCKTDTAVAQQTTLIEPEIEQKVEDLLSRMTLEEKVGQMNQYNGTWDVTGPPPTTGDNANKYEALASGKVGSMLNVLGAEATREAQEIAVEETRLGIPLIFGYDVIHGYKTIFPIPLGEAASWDLEAIKKNNTIAAKEAASAGIHWAFSPMMDVSRDARWGRVMEGAGEDPYLASKVAVARVQGLQGEDLSDLNTVAATAKHFAGYGFVVAGLDYNTTEINRNTLLNMVLPPFKAAVDAGVATVMNSFNDVNGIPVTGNAFLQRDILKGDWGFKGPILSDWNTIGEMTINGYAADLKDAAYKAATGGTDMDMETRGYEQHLVELVEEGKVDEALIDDAVRRILRVKFQLGLFEDPYRYSDSLRENQNTYTEENRAVAREAARKSIVLLKNKNDVLPLSKDLGSIAVIGDLADDKDTPIGSWRAQATANSAVSLLEGVKAAVNDGTEVHFAQGYTLAIGDRAFVNELTFADDDGSDIPEAVRLAQNSDAVIVAVGEEAFQSGEGRSQTDISLKGKQLELLQELKKVNDNVVVVLMNGRPIAEPWMYENMPSILETWHLGTEAGNGIADVIFGDYNPAGKLPVSIPRSVGQVPIYYNHVSTGRPNATPGQPEMVFWSHYTDEEKTPQYYFGHGLSYTTFEYDNLKLSKDSMKMGEAATVSVEVTNTGDRAGEEVVQLYIQDVAASTIRPVRELKGFEKLMFEAGETKTITFELNEEVLGFYGADETFKAEPGEFKIMVGGNATDVLTESFSLNEK